jgi:hypothetical protein
VQIDKACAEILDLFGPSLANLEQHFQDGPPSLPATEIEVRRARFLKMATRARRGDIEGNFRRVWLLNAALQHYFQLRQRWYEARKKALAWLAKNGPGACGRFDLALRPAATGDDIVRWPATLLRPASTNALIWPRQLTFGR